MELIRRKVLAETEWKSEFDERRKPGNLREMLCFGKEYLEEHGISDAAVDAWLLLEHVTGLSRAQYLARATESLGAVCATLQAAESQDIINVSPRAAESQDIINVSPRAADSPDLLCQDCSAEEMIRKYWKLLEKRGRHIPLQHLTGEQEFMGLPFLVNEHVLIPRQDTETLVEEALTRLRPGMRVLDLCTGSGCIAVSLAKLGPEYIARRIASDKKNEKGAESARQEISVDASDISPEALAVARENARRLGVQVQFIESDLFAGMEAGFEAGIEVGVETGIEKKYHMIVSNPPYIRTSVIAELMEEVRLHEPLQALDGSEDGLLFYREIVWQSPAHLLDGGWLLFEIGYDQAKAVRDLMAGAGFTEIQVIRDLAGYDRVIGGRKFHV